MKCKIKFLLSAKLFAQEQQQRGSYRYENKYLNIKASHTAMHGYVDIQLNYNFEHKQGKDW